MFTSGKVMRNAQRGAVVGSILGIFACGVIGGYVAWLAVTALGIEGVGAAILAAAIGMVAATGLWAGGSMLLRTLGFIR
jgi:hypothetical protein